MAFKTQGKTLFFPVFWVEATDISVQMKGVNRKRRQKKTCLSKVQIPEKSTFSKCNNKVSVPVHVATSSTLTLLAGIEEDSCSSGVCLCWGLARLYQYNLLLLSQHGLIWVNLHPVTTHLVHTHMHTHRTFLYRWWRRVWRLLHPPCWPHTPGYGSGRAPWSSRSGGSQPPSGRRWTLSVWTPPRRPTGWRWAGGNTCGGACIVTFPSLRSAADSRMCQ